MRASAFFVASFLLLSSGSLRAEDTDAARGRLPDGRAFRTDAQGNQLVDYIAELELSVEQLNRRVHGLEFEVEERQKQIERMSKRGAGDDSIAERDLLNSRAASAVNSREASFSVPAEAFPEANSESQQAACVQQVAATQQLLEKARFDLEVSRRVQEKSRAEYEDNVDRLRAQYSNLKCPRADCSTEVSKVSAEADKARQELNQTKLSYDAERQAQQKRINDYEASLTQLRNDLVTRDARLRDLELKLAAATVKQAPSQTLLSASVERSMEKPVLAPVEVVKAPEQHEAARASTPPMFRGSGPDQRASLSTAKSRAVDSLRGSMTGDIRRLRDLIQTRDSLFQGFNQTGKAYTFKPSPLISSRGYTLSWVTERVRGATSVYELAALAKDLREIRSKVQEDIDLIKRTKRSAN